MDKKNRQERRCIKRIIATADEEAAAELINAYYSTVYSFVISQMKDFHTAMDVTQETFIAMLNNIAQYDSRKASLKTWIFTIANNKIIDYYRSKYYKMQLLTDDITLINITDNSPIDSEAQIEIVEKALSILEKLSADSQQIVRLKIFAELTFIEIANVLKLPESTVKSKYYAAIRKLRQLMEVK